MRLHVFYCWLERGMVKGLARGCQQGNQASTSTFYILSQTAVFFFQISNKDFVHNTVEPPVMATSLHWPLFFCPGRQSLHSLHKRIPTTKITSQQLTNCIQNHIFYCKSQENSSILHAIGLCFSLLVVSVLLLYFKFTCYNKHFWSDCRIPGPAIYKKCWCGLKDEVF